MLIDKKSLPGLLAGHPDLLAEFESLPGKRNEQQHLELLDKLNQRLH